jgi:hypothetical protein
MAVKTRISLTAAAFMTCASGIASAATVTQTKTSVFSKGSPFTQTFNGFVPGSNGVPVGAVLTSVSDTLNDSYTATTQLKNTSGATGTFSIILNDQATKTLAGVLTVSETAPGTPLFSGTLAGGATTSGTFAGSGKSTVSDSTPADLAKFEAASITADVTSFLVRNPGLVGFPNIETDVGTGTFSDTLVYTYSTSATPTPEPATLTLLGSGLLGLGLARAVRRRRKN